MTDDRVNPLLREWQTPFGLPPFGEFAPEHFPPAFDRAMRVHADEIAAIAGSTAARTEITTPSAQATTIVPPPTRK